MALKTDNVIVGDQTIAVIQFTGRNSLMIKAKLVKLFAPMMAPALKEILTNSKGLNDILDTEVTKLLAGEIETLVDKLVASMSPEEYADTVMQLLSGCYIGDKQMDWTLYDVVFADNQRELYRVLKFVITFNYGSLFGKGGTGNTRPVQAAPPNTANQTA